MLPLQAGDIVGVNVITVIGTDGGEGDIVQDYISYIAEIRAVRRETRPAVNTMNMTASIEISLIIQVLSMSPSRCAVNMKNSLKYQKRRLKTICSETPFMLRYHDSNVD